MQIELKIIASDFSEIKAALNDYIRKNVHPLEALGAAVALENKAAAESDVSDLQSAPAEKKERKPRAKKDKGSAAAGSALMQQTADAAANAQDKADEKAESDAAKEASGGKLTHDDIRKELGVYVKKYGMPAAQEDGPKLFAKAFPGKGFAKTSDIPDDQKSLQTAVDGVREMTTKNPFERKVVIV